MSNTYKMIREALDKTSGCHCTDDAEDCDSLASELANLLDNGTELESTEYTKMRRFFRNYSDSLTVLDFHPNSYVFVEVDDGSTFKVNAAKLVTKDGWTAVVSEHYPVMLFNNLDLIDAYAIEEQRVQPMELE